MTWWQAALLGLLQGLTEFLPVSSSGHLALAQRLVPGFHQPGVVFDAMLHVGTTVAVLVHEVAALRRMIATAAGRRLALLLGLGTAATAIVAFPLKDLAEGAFGKVSWVGVGLLVTAAVVLATRWLPGGARGENSTGWRDAVSVGLVQGLAVFPGVSRSGATIAAGLAGGLDRAWAARFSFLLSVPAVLGATAASLLGEREALATVGSGFWVSALIGAAVAAVSGYIAVRLVLRALSTRHFHRFAWYCLPLGLIVLALSLGGWW